MPDEGRTEALTKDFNADGPDVVASGQSLDVEGYLTFNADVGKGLAIQVKGPTGGVLPNVVTELHILQHRHIRVTFARCPPKGSTVEVSYTYLRFANPEPSALTPAKKRKK